MRDWEQDLAALLAHHDADVSDAERHHEERRREARGFMENQLRAAFTDLTDAFARFGRGRTVETQFSLDRGKKVLQTREPAGANPLDNAWAQLTVLQGHTPEFVYRLQLTVTPEVIFLRKAVSTPGSFAGDPLEDLKESELNTDLGHSAVPQLTREEIIQDVLDEYRQCLEGPTP
jgi:hypothetical protein